MKKKRVQARGEQKRGEVKSDDNREREESG